MTTAFDYEKYEKEPDKAKVEPFDFAKYEKKQEPLTLKGSAQAYGAGAAGGAGGIVGDLGKLGLLGAVGQLAPAAGVKTTPEITESLNPQGPQNALERILQHAGEFGGLEATIGTGAGGPVGGVLGLAHGSVGGALYGAAKELGANETVALLAALSTLSVPAAERLIAKMSVSKKSKDALKSAIAREKGPPPPPGEPPPPTQPPAPPEVAGIGPGKVLPQTESTFAEKERILGQLAEREVPPPLGIETQVAEPRGVAPSLQGRATQQPSLQEVVENLQHPVQTKPLGVEARVAETKGAAPALQGRLSTEPELGEIFAREPFESEAQITRQTGKEVKEVERAEKQVVDEKYKKADEIVEAHSDFHPKLVEENERRISRLEELEKRSVGEEAEYQDRLALRRMIGEPGGMLEVNSSKLMKQANSFSKKINYEEPYAGAKAQIKSMVHQMNQAVIESLERTGLESNLADLKKIQVVQDADRTFGRYADRFMNDEIAPYLHKKILNPEELGRKAINDPAAYRAIKQAMGSRTSPLVGKIDRELVHKSMDKYAKNPEMVGGKEYVRDLRNLSERIGKEKIADVDHYLRQKQLNFEKKLLGERKIKEAELSRKKLPEKPPLDVITEKLAKPKAAQDIVHKVMDKYEKNPDFINSKSYYKDLEIVKKLIGEDRARTLDRYFKAKKVEYEKGATARHKISEGQLVREGIPEKPSPAKISEKISHEKIAQTPEQLDKVFKEPSKIRHLKKVMQQKGLEKEFEKLVEDRIQYIFKEGAYGERKLTGKDVVRIIDKNHDVLSELLTPEGLKELKKIGTIAENQELSKELLEKILRRLGKVALQTVGLGKLIKILPF